MTDKTYFLRLRLPTRRFHVVTAANAEVHSDHLVFLNSRGELLLLFLLEMVESWNEI